jgi:phage-related protein
MQRAREESRVIPAHAGIQEFDERTGFRPVPGRRSWRGLAASIHWPVNNKYVTIYPLDYTIHYYSEAVQDEVLALPKTLLARYQTLTRRLLEVGPNLGDPHSQAFGGGLFELRLKGAEGIARVFYCALIGRRIVMLHSFVKKSDKPPLADRRLAEDRLKEVKNANA